MVELNQEQVGQESQNVTEVNYDQIDNFEPPKNNKFFLNTTGNFY
jgi:hypothetical protein